MEYLSPGDRVVTRDAGFVTLSGLAAIEAHTDLCRVEPAAFGHGIPTSGVTLPVAQSVLIRDRRMAQACGVSPGLVTVGALAAADVPGIEEISARQVRLISLVFTTPHIVYAGGLELAAAILAPA